MFFRSSNWSSSRDRGKGGFLRVMARQLIEQDHIKQRLVDLDAAAIADKAEFAKTIHKEADA